MTSYTTQFFTGYAPPDQVVERAEVARIAEELGERYEVMGYINKGGFATVWEARDHIAGIPVAVKRLNNNAKRAGAFYRELRAMFRLVHPNIVRLVNFLESEGSRYLIMELCHGGSLRASISRGNRKQHTCTPERANSIIGQIANGLAAAHSEGFSHRDIKPENILFSSASNELFGGSGYVKLADFGLASLLRPTSDDDGLRSITGSPTYMAPEQFQGVFEPASDVYALGIVAYELLHGMPPFSGSPETLALKHLNETAEFNPALPKTWSELLPRMLAKRSADRPKASEVVSCLEDSTMSAVAVWNDTKQSQWSFDHDLRSPLSSVQPLTGRCRFLAVTEAGFSILHGENNDIEVRLEGICHAHEVPGGLVFVVQSGEVYRWELESGLARIATLTNAARLHSVRDAELLSYTHDGNSVQSWKFPQQEPVWKRTVNAGGLKSMLAINREGQLAAVEFEGVARLRFFQSDGSDLGSVPLPGLCWQLQASGKGAFAARLLTGRGFAAYICSPDGCRRFAGSLGLGHFAADSNSTASAGIWPDGTVRWWANEKAKPRELPGRLEMEGLQTFAVSGRHLAFGNSSGIVRMKKVARPLQGVHHRG